MPALTRIFGGALFLEGNPSALRGLCMWISGCTVVKKTESFFFFKFFKRETSVSFYELVNQKKEGYVHHVFQAWTPR